MAKRKRQWHDLSERARKRAELAGRGYGLTRKQTRERYNRGTYNPLASKGSNLRVPRNFREFAEGGVVDWKTAAYDNVTKQIGDYFKFNEFAVLANIEEHASEMALRIMAMASEDELIAYARIQEGRNGAPPQMPPGIKPTDIGYFTNGRWNNIFWYH